MAESSKSTDGRVNRFGADLKLEASGIVFPPHHSTVPHKGRTHAVQLIAAGVDILTISRRLGHANVTVTLNTDDHMVPGGDDRAARALETASFSEQAQNLPRPGSSSVTLRSRLQLHRGLSI